MRRFPSRNDTLGAGPAYLPIKSRLPSAIGRAGVHGKRRCTEADCLSPEMAAHSPRLSQRKQGRARGRRYGVLVGASAGAPPELAGAGAKMVGPDGFTTGVVAGATAGVAAGAAGRGVGVRGARSPWPD